MSTRSATTPESTEGRAVSPLVVVLAWLWVLIPFGYGVVQLIGPHSRAVRLRAAG